MAIVRWDPFKDLTTLQERMNKLFEESIGRGRLLGEEDMLVRGTWNPAVDIYETKDQIVLKAEFPGLKQEDIKIEISDNTLTLRGERKFEKNIKEENYHCIERSYGSFARAFSLPASIQQDKISANLKKGVLEIILPKSEPNKIKKIKIHHED